jgi:hypothetical protein
MGQEFFNKAIDGVISALLRIRGEEVFSGIKNGEVFWEMRHKDGTSQKGKMKNIVSFDASILLARFVKGAGTSTPHVSDPNYGAFALAVGTGDVSWNPLNPPAATKSQRSLYNEIARKAISSSSFINRLGQITVIPTNVIDLTTTFSESEAVGPLTEMALIGGDISSNMSIRNPVLPPNGTYDPSVNLIGKDTILNYLTFPVVSKGSGSSLEYTWRLSF